MSLGEIYVTELGDWRLGNARFPGNVLAPLVCARVFGAKAGSGPPFPLDWIKGCLPMEALPASSEDPSFPPGDRALALVALRPEATAEVSGLDGGQAGASGLDMTPETLHGRQSVAGKKIPETPDFIRGLLKSADSISELLNPEHTHPRYLLQKIHDDEVKLENLTSEDRGELGLYQSRVVLVVLATELALKFLWNYIPEGNKRPSENNHELSLWYKRLPISVRDQIEAEYCARSDSPPPGWETLGRVFISCRGASVQWRYLVEEGSIPDYVMHATCLIDATLSVLTVGENLAEGK